MPRRIGESDAGDRPSSKWCASYTIGAGLNASGSVAGGAHPNLLRFGLGPRAPQPGSFSIAKYCARAHDSSIGRVICGLLFKASSETTLTIAADPGLMRSPRHAAA